MGKSQRCPSNCVLVLLGVTAAAILAMVVYIGVTKLGNGSGSSASSNANAGQVGWVRGKHNSFVFCRPREILIERSPCVRYYWHLHFVPNYVLIYVPIYVLTYFHLLSFFAYSCRPMVTATLEGVVLS